MKYLSLVLLSLFICSCSEKKLEPITDSLGKPGVVTDIEVTPVPGGAVVSYRIPNSEDILAVEGRYILADGKEHKVTSSFYENKVEILGYNDMVEHKAKLYVVNRAQEFSDPVEVSFTPLESSLSKTIKTVDIISDFGGAQFNWRNKDKAPFTVEFLAEDSLSQMQTLRIMTTEADSGRYSLRGFQPEARRFGMIIRDYYDNASDTIYPAGGTLVPLFEEALNKKHMVVMKLGSDANFTNWEGMDSYLIDDDHDTFGHSPSNSLPAAFTVDLGCVAKPSRVVMFQRKYSDSYYNWGNPKQFEVYTFKGTGAPSQDGNWDEWEKVLDCEIVKPSGSPSGTVTDEDFTAGVEGHEFSFELSQEPIRYIRFKILNTWGGSSFTHPADVDFYGEVVQ
ncbi:DUF5000 domain-containing lipoprotein [Parabacteroides sp. AM08-6]|uniref:DUF5000 domain-containing lipoprotein n=1 Tax=Parabacteroides sp. AM08-6 TaxID=2292053 RepID=UPI001F35F17B|nr:DUF5000 domain-containing lipoprotein [Parabacteroides sp. AM08-6]